jgi:predicted CxxxxCH...CXXCH cytochrome family protein
MRSRLLTLGLLAALSACGVARPEHFGEAKCPDYEVLIRPVVEAQCGTCHAILTPAGEYRVGAYADTVSRRWDGKALVQPGSVDAPFLQAARGQLSSHSAIDVDALATLTDWNVRCRAGPKQVRWHNAGWLTPTDAVASHGRYLRGGGQAQAQAYPFEECVECHGDDFRGGKSGASCFECHAEGPKGCNTCHGEGTSPAPPRALNGAKGTAYVGVGAHRSHVTPGALGKSFDCTLCHQKPADVTDDGHYRKGTVNDLTLAEVTLSTSGPGGTVEWSHANATCTNTYCHAPSVSDANATARAPKWTNVGSGQAACGACHGIPPASHADDRCEVCHGTGYSRTQVNPTLHLNFVVDVKGDGTRCSACHAGPGDAQFHDLLGQKTPSIRTVGAHQAHLTAGQFRAPLTCDNCHQVPSSLHSQGHIDSAGPAEVTFVAGNLATTGRAEPTYSTANATCGSVYCHGAGTKADRDTASTKVTSLVWNGPSSQVVCGSCHGVPPQDGSVAHTGRTLTECVNCHDQSVTSSGEIRFTTDAITGKSVTTHLDGKLTGNE